MYEKAAADHHHTQMMNVPAEARCFRIRKASGKIKINRNTVQTLSSTKTETEASRSFPRGQVLTCRDHLQVFDGRHQPFSDGRLQYGAMPPRTMVARPE